MIKFKSNRILNILNSFKSYNYDKSAFPYVLDGNNSYVNNMMTLYRTNASNGFFDEPSKERVDYTPIKLITTKTPLNQTVEFVDSPSGSQIIIGITDNESNVISYNKRGGYIKESVIRSKIYNNELCLDVIDVGHVDGHPQAIKDGIGIEIPLEYSKTIDNKLNNILHNYTSSGVYIKVYFNNTSINMTEK